MLVNKLSVLHVYNIWAVSTPHLECDGNSTIKFQISVKRKSILGMCQCVDLMNFGETDFIHASNAVK